MWPEAWVRALGAGLLPRLYPGSSTFHQRIDPLLRPSAWPADPDARFEHFKRALWPRIKEAGAGGGTLIYLPSYFDYVR